PTSISTFAGSPLLRTNSSLSANGTTSSARLCRMTVPGLTVLAVPCLFHAGQSRTSFASPLLMVMATAAPLDEPTTTSRWCLSSWAWAILTASAKSSCAEFQPCRKRMRMVARPSRRLVPGQGNQHRLRQAFHTRLPQHVDDLRRRVVGAGADVQQH